MKDWMSMYDYYLRDLPGCTTFAAANELRKAAQEFCKRAKVWRAKMDPITMQAGVSQYDYDITSDREVLEIVSAKLDGQDINLLLPEEDDGLSAGVIQTSTRTFEIYPTPAAGQKLSLKVILFPSNVAPGVEDSLFSEYAEAIALGAKYRLKKIPGMEFTDLQGALLDQDAFELAISRAQVRAARGNGRAPLRVRGRFL